MKRLERGLYWDRSLTLVEGCGPGSFSPGCDNCWARNQTHVRARQSNLKIRARYEGLTDECGDWTGAVRLMEDALALPGKVRKSTRWAIWNDLFHPNVPDSFIGEAYNVFHDNPRHTFLVLTKQARRLHDWHTRSMYLLNAPLPNLWIGVTAENQSRWDERTPYLRDIPAVVKWVSFEPLLGPINTGDIGWLDWAVIGGESGAHARPCHPHWVCNLRNVGLTYDVRVFFKQWGAWKPISWYYRDTRERDDAIDMPHILVTGTGAQWDIDSDGQPPRETWIMRRMGKRTAGRDLNGLIWNQLPDMLDPAGKEQ